MLKAIRRGAKVYVVDPRRTATAEWADGWLSVNVGADIALANAVSSAILEEGLENREFIRRATDGFDAWAAHVRPRTPESVAHVTGVDPQLVRRLARDYAKADRAMICWTLGITEHHNAVDNVLSLINLSLATGHVGKWGSGLNPLRGQNNVQGGGDMGALPHKLPGFQDVEDAAVRAKWEAEWGRPIHPKAGLHMTGMFEAMAHGELKAMYVIGENPVQSEADQGRTTRLLSGLEHLVVQDIFRTKTAELAHVVLPASVSFCESEGTVTNSERRVQRVRKALEPPGQARDDIAIIAALSKRLGFDMGEPTPQQAWDEMRKHSPLHGGMSYARLEQLGGIQWPCPDETSEGQSFLHGRLWNEPVGGRRAPFSVTHDEPPVEALDAEFPLRLTTGRRLDSYNTGVQSGGFSSPGRQGETVDLSPFDAGALGVKNGEKVRVVSRRGAVVAPARVDPGLKPGLVFMTFHFPEQVETNVLTIDATDPRSGTAEFKAAAVRVERLT